MRLTWEQKLPLRVLAVLGAVAMLLALWFAPARAGVVLLDFGSPSCGPCAQMEPVIRNLEAGGTAVLRFNVQQDRRTAAQYNVSSTPTYIALLDGREYARVVGITPQADMEQMLNVTAAASSPLAAASCRIEVDGPERNRGMFMDMGSGTLIAPGRVITCYHLFRDYGTDRVFVYFGGVKYAAFVIKQDPTADLALLAVNGLPDTIVPTGWSTEVGHGCVFAVCGFGSGVFRQVSGMFDQWWTGEPGRQTFSLNVAVREGDSGGGVFDSTGRLIAVVWGCDGKVHATSGAPMSIFLWGK